MTRLAQLVLLVGLSAAIACGKDPGPDPGPKPASLVIVEGNGQSGPVGQPLAGSVTVRVLDDNGAGLAGVAVTFVVTAGGGSVTSASATTGATGNASTVWVLGGLLGSQVVTASAAGLPAVTFTATGTVGPPSNLVVTSGNNQTGALGAALPDSIRIRVEDQFGNPTPGVSITWQVVAGGGSVSPATTTSGADGRSAAQFSLGPANAATSGNSLLASVTGSGVSGFASATGQLTAGTVSVVSGDQQSGSPGVRLLGPVRVVVRTPGGAVVNGASVTWNVVTGSGTLETASQATDGNGVSTNRWTLGPSGGQQSITAQVATVPGPPLTLTATAVVPPPGVISGLVGEPAQFAGPPQSFAAALAGLGRSGLLRSGGAEPARMPRPVSAAVRYAPNTLLVRFRPTVLTSPGPVRTQSAALAAGQMLRARLDRLVVGPGVRRQEVSPAILAARLTVRPGVDLDSLRRVIETDPGVASVSREEILHADGYRWQALPTAPDDPLYPNQSWHYVMIDLPRAWNITTGSQSVLVAVLDTGIRFDHPVFAGRLTSDGYDFVPTDSLSICAGGRFDNAGDGGGYDNDPTQPSDRPFEDETARCWGDLDQAGGHGLHTAGTIGAAGNDGVGGTGVNWNVKIRPVRVLGVGGTGNTFDIAQGVLYAAGLPASDGNNGTLAPPATPARIINMSLGGGCNTTGPSPLRDAIQAATNAGVLVVVSAGNENSSTSQVCPAGYPEPITVSAVGPFATKAGYSNFGSAVDIAAPGGDLGPNRTDGTFLVHSAVCDFRSDPCVPGYARYAGTSMAAPHVSGVAALLLAQNPTLTVSQLRDRLLNFAVDLGPAGSDEQFGKGLLNARNSLTQSLAPARKALVRIYNATTGAIVQTAPASASGAFSFSGVQTGDYWVFAGEDEDNDGLLGVPGRRFTAFGGAITPAVLRTTASGGAAAFFLHGDAREAEPNGTRETAGRLVIGGSVAGEMPDNDPADLYVVDVPVAGTYTFETSGFGGAFCRFALELNTKLTLQDSQGTTLDSNDDIDPKEGVSLVGNRCSRVRRALTPGRYFVVVEASAGTNPTNPGIHTGRYRLEARIGQ